MQYPALASGTLPSRQRSRRSYLPKVLVEQPILDFGPVPIESPGLFNKHELPVVVDIVGTVAPAHSRCGPWRVAVLPQQALDLDADRRLAGLSAVRALVEGPHWSVYTNFHFGHMEGGYAWCATTIDVDRYVDLWEAKISDAGAVNRHEWNEYWDWLLREGIASPGDRIEVDRHFTATQRQTATPRPGLRLIRHWDRTEAEALDGQHVLGGEIASALAAVATALSTP